MFCMNGNAIDLLLKVELYPIKLDGKLTLSLNQNTNTTSMYQLLQNYQF